MIRLRPSHAEGSAALRAGLAVVAAFVLLGGTPSVAEAHSDVVETVPDDGAAVEEAPGWVAVRFDALLEVGSTIAVHDENAAQVDLGDVTIEPVDGGGGGSTLAVSLRDGLAPGRYSIRWTAVAADGDAVEGASSFTVERGRSAARTPS